MNFQEIIQFGLTGWVKDKNTIKYGVILFVIMAIMNIALSFLLAGVMKGVLGLDESNFDLNAIGIFILSIFIYVIIYIVLNVIAEYLFYERALQQNKKKSIPLSLVRLVKVIFYGFVSSLFSLFSIFNLKFLLVGIIGVLTIIIGVVVFALSVMYPFIDLIAWLLVIVGFLLIFTYFAIVIYNSIRLSLGIISYIEKEITIVNSLKESYELTRKNVLNLIIVYFVLVIIVGLLNFALSLPASIYQQVLMLGIGADTNPLFIFEKYFTDPVLLILQIPTYLGVVISIIVSAYTSVKVYTELINNSKSKKSKVIKKKKK